MIGKFTRSLSYTDYIVSETLMVMSQTSELTDKTMYKISYEDFCKNLQTVIITSKGVPKSVGTASSVGDDLQLSSHLDYLDITAGTQLIFNSEIVHVEDKIPPDKVSTTPVASTKVDEEFRYKLPFIVNTDETGDYKSYFASDIARIKGGLSLEGEIEIYGKVTVVGDYSITGSFNVSGSPVELKDITVENLNLKGDLIKANSLPTTVRNLYMEQGDLIVHAGDILFSGTIDIKNGALNLKEGNLSVDGRINISSTSLEVTSYDSPGDVFVSHSVLTGGDVGVGKGQVRCSGLQAKKVKVAGKTSPRFRDLTIRANKLHNRNLDTKFYTAERKELVGGVSNDGCFQNKMPDYCRASLFDSSEIVWATEHLIEFTASYDPLGKFDNTFHRYIADGRSFNHSSYFKRSKTDNLDVTGLYLIDCWVAIKTDPTFGGHPLVPGQCILVFLDIGSHLPSITRKAGKVSFVNDSVNTTLNPYPWQLKLHISEVVAMHQNESVQVRAIKKFNLGDTVLMDYFDTHFEIIRIG